MWAIIIEKIIDCRYIGISPSYRQIVEIEKSTFRDYQKTINIENFHRLNSVESTAPKTRKIVFHIPDEYEIVVENSAQRHYGVRKYFFRRKSKVNI